MKKKLEIPKFKTRAEENSFWDSIDIGDYLEADDFSGASFPNLKMTTKPITIRIPISMIDRVKLNAHEMDVPYQTLIKQYIFQGLRENQRSENNARIADKSSGK